MTVRLSDEATDFLDARVAVGPFTSRALYLTWLVEREAQRERALATSNGCVSKVRSPTPTRS